MRRRGRRAQRYRMLHRKKVHTCPSAHILYPLNSENAIPSGAFNMNYVLRCNRHAAKDSGRCRRDHDRRDGFLVRLQPFILFSIRRDLSWHSRCEIAAVWKEIPTLTQALDGRQDTRRAHSSVRQASQSLFSHCNLLARPITLSPDRNCDDPRCAESPIHALAHRSTNIVHIR
jgi:hypothetical protein